VSVPAGTGYAQLGKLPVSAARFSPPDRLPQSANRQAIQRTPPVATLDAPTALARGQLLMSDNVVTPTAATTTFTRVTTGATFLLGILLLVLVAAIPAAGHETDQYT